MKKTPPTSSMVEGKRQSLKMVVQKYSKPSQKNKNFCTTKNIVFDDNDEDLLGLYDNDEDLLGLYDSDEDLLGLYDSDYYDNSLFFQDWLRHTSDTDVAYSINPYYK